MGQSLYSSSAVEFLEVFFMKTQEVIIREKIVSLHKKNKSTREIAYLLDISKSKAAFWVKRYNDVGDLNNKPRPGRPTKLTSKRLSSLKKIITDKFLESNSKNSGVTSKEIRKVIESKTGKFYTLRHVQRLLHKMGFSLITPRTNHIKHDQNAVDKFRDEFKKNSHEPMWSIY
jgi:transposase